MCPKSHTRPHRAALLDAGWRYDIRVRAVGLARQPEPMLDPFQRRPAAPYPPRLQRLINFASRCATLPCLRRHDDQQRSALCVGVPDDGVQLCLGQGSGMTAQTLPAASPRDWSRAGLRRNALQLRGCDFDRCWPGVDDLAVLGTFDGPVAMAVAFDDSGVSAVSAFPERESED